MNEIHRFLVEYSWVPQWGLFFLIFIGWLIDPHLRGQK